MVKQRNRQCRKCTEPYDYVDVSRYFLSLSGFLRCRYCNYYNEIRPRLNKLRRIALFCIILLSMLFIVSSAMGYIFSEHIASAPFLSDTENYRKTEVYVLNSQVYKSRTAAYVAGLYLFLLAFLPAFILSRLFLNIIYYFKGWTKNKTVSDDKAGLSR